MYVSYGYCMYTSMTYVCINDICMHTYTLMFLSLSHFLPLTWDLYVYVHTYQRYTYASITYVCICTHICIHMYTLTRMLTCVSLMFTRARSLCMCMRKSVGKNAGKQGRGAAQSKGTSWCGAAREKHTRTCNEAHPWQQRAGDGRCWRVCAYGGRYAVVFSFFSFFPS